MLLSIIIYTLVDCSTCIHTTTHTCNAINTCLLLVRVCAAHYMQQTSYWVIFSQQKKAELFKHKTQFVRTPYKLATLHDNYTYMYCMQQPGHAHVTLKWHTRVSNESDSTHASGTQQPCITLQQQRTSTASSECAKNPICASCCWC